MNALEKWIAENPHDKWYKKDFVWHDDAGNIFILPTEDDPDWNVIEDRDYEDNWLDYFPEDGEEIFLDYLPGPTPEILYQKMTAWTNRPNKRTGWRIIHDEEPNVAGCPYCPANRGCNSSPYRFKRKDWKRLRKTQYKV